MSQIVKTNRKWKYPVGVEREYQRVCRDLVAIMYDSVKKSMLSIKKVMEDNPLRLRHDSLYNEKVDMIFREMRKRYDDSVSDKYIYNKINQIFKQGSNFNKKEFKDIMRSALKVDVFNAEPWLKPLSELWTRENVSLIKSIEPTYLDQVETIVLSGMREGKLINDIEDDLEKSYSITSKRAQFIARDQVGKLNGNLTRYRQQSIGIEKYIWSTSKDARVREIHSLREGKEFEWNNPPPGGHPGQDYNCRCVALPVIDLDKINFVSANGTKIEKGIFNNPINELLIGSNINDSTKELFDKYLSDEYITIDNKVNKPLYYSNDTGKIVINAKSDKWSYYDKKKALTHEIIHLIDDEEGIAIGNVEMLGKGMDNATKHILSNRAKYEALFDNDKYALNISLSDIFSNLTQNEIRGNYAHSNKYWDMIGNSEKELIADLLSEYITEDEESLEVISEIPALNTILERLIKIYGTIIKR